ncbi:glutathione S-transferase N-terminal domain-containing protein [Sphingomonas sp. ID0503]|uniref:glutathione S-transferase N-terminal domain-containing protein n=1 Tax=Sphingomonas sp. ID0503 TaxID=3399691 RepID=UPI003AFB151B
MIDLFFATSPNVYKVSIALEEMELPHRLVPVDLSQGQHHDPAKLGGGVTGKVPVIVDHSPADGQGPYTVVESGAILQYLGEKTGRFLPSTMRQRSDVMQWLFWQVGGIGPIGGQTWHFRMFAPKIAPHFDNSYAMSRYDTMFAKLWRTMDDRLADRAYLCGDYSIADMATFPWVAYLEPQDGIDAYPNVRRWRDAIAARPAVRAAYAKGEAIDTGYERNEKGVSLFPWEGLMQHVIAT